jgi:hypothetical protein
MYPQKEMKDVLEEEHLRKPLEMDGRMLSWGCHRFLDINWKCERKRKKVGKGMSQRPKLKKGPSVTAE